MPAHKSRDDPVYRAQLLKHLDDIRPKALEAARVSRVDKVVLYCIDCGTPHTYYKSSHVNFEHYRCQKCATKHRWELPGYREHQILINTGRKASELTRAKIAASLQGREVSDADRIIQMESHGRQIWYGGVRYYLKEVEPAVPEDPALLLDWLFGRFDRKEKQRQATRERRGPLNPRWKGGISTLNHAIRDCEKGLAWRDAVFRRDNFTCQVTGHRGNGLEAHHIIPLSKLIRKYGVTTLDEALAIPEFWDVSNGITLKGELHKAKHRRKSKVKETWQIKLVCSESTRILSQ